MSADPTPPMGGSQVRVETSRIQALRQIVASGEWAKIDGQPVGPYSATHAVGLYESLTSPTREAYARLKVDVMIELAFTKVVHKPGRGARRG